MATRSSSRRTAARSGGWSVANADYEPLKITAELEHGGVGSYDLVLPFDALLSYAWMWEHHPEAMRGVQKTHISRDDLIVPEPPLAKIRNKAKPEEWYWAASLAFGAILSEEKRPWRKRPDGTAAERYRDTGKRKNILNISSGPEKAYDVKLPVFNMAYRRLTWYAVGAGEEVERLLAGSLRLAAIGKKHAAGHGFLRLDEDTLRPAWTVEPADEDLSVASLRPVPDAEGEYFWAIRPPGWLRENQMTVRWPEHPDLACNRLTDGRFGVVA